MSSFNKEVIDNLADKLLIGLTPEENKMILDEFTYIEKSMNLINKIDGISDVTPMVHPFPISYTLTNEEPVNELNIDEVLQNCDDKDNREIKVPKVVGE